MKITYTGMPGALNPAETGKVEAKFGMIAKLLDAPKGEREAHVILSQERHLTHAEITVRYQDHHFAGIGAAADAYTAIGAAIEKLEKQILRLRERTRDSYRGPKVEKTAVEAPATPASEAAAEPETAGPPQVFRVNHHQRRKPMTIEEALLEIEGRNYVVYHDAETDRVSVLVRRRDGNFDLIEA
ncbi:MAG: HPF/RaiA family ribosome-associated protein [Bryobacteraceae bacterium]|jgi:putative sigma-54 modulation protein